jgi:diguanylate cyclase (GGDEF)-like protein
MKFRLSTRLVLSVVLIEAVMLTVLVWNSVRLIGSSHAEVLEKHFQDELTLLSNLLAPGLAADDRAILVDALSLMKNEGKIVYAVVLNNAGSTMASIGKVPDKIIPDLSYQDAKLDGCFDSFKEISLSNQKLGMLKLGYSIQYVEKLINKTRTQNAIIASIEILLSILVTFGVGYLLTRSLRQLEEGAKALTRDELDHRIKLDSRDEMGDLARAFNNLASHLSQTRTALADEHYALVKKTRELQTLLDGVNAIVVEADPGTCRFKYVSREAQSILGYPTGDWYVPNFLEEHIYQEDREQFKQQRDAHNQQPGTAIIDFRMTHMDGHLVDIRSINNFDYDESGVLTCRSLFLDVTEQKLNEQRIAYLAEHDALTGLFNRSRFQEELERALDYADRFEQQGALMFIDLDQFKYINDTMGHQAGDEYLVAIAQSLACSIRKVDILGRLGGDEFGIILPNTSRIEAEDVARILLKKLIVSNEEFTGMDTPVTASIGIVIFPEHGSVPGNLLAMADAAMYSAKDEGRNTYHIYQEADQQISAMHAKLEWEQRIRKALEKDLFVLHFQPIFHLDSRKVSHYEVLLRMLDNDGGLIPPGAFLEIAERFGMIRDVDRWVLNKAIEVQGESNRTGSPVRLAVNLSGRHFGNPQVLDWIKSQISNNNANPEMLIFEITETAAVENISNARRFTDDLHALGCRVALDDFGVGFSSFHYLKHLPVDMIKLDGSFVRQLARDKFDRVFVKAMSQMARGLGITSTAEFIESEEVIEILLELGVDLGQGFHLARPSESFTYPCEFELIKAAK